MQIFTLNYIFTVQIYTLTLSSENTFDVCVFADIGSVLYFTFTVCLLNFILEENVMSVLKHFRSFGLPTDGKRISVSTFLLVKRIRRG